MHYDATSGAAQANLAQTFAYDTLGRLTGVLTASNSWTIGYDASGNRSSVLVDGASSNTYTTASNSNRLMNTTSPARNFAYDNAGNTTGDGQFNSTFSLAGRMATLTKAGVTTTYSVDAFGRRVRKFSSTGKASTVIYVYDQQGQLLGEYDSAGVALREYVWLNSTPVAVFTPDPTGATRPPLVFYIHTDHLDAPRVVVDKNNAARWSWLAEPFGTTTANGNPAGLGAFTFNLRLPGQVFDAESGLHYNFFRDYDAGSGRYVQSDPIGLQGGINTYSYVFGNPLIYADPLGLDVEVGVRPFHPVPVQYAKHCFLRFNGNNNDTLSFDNKGVHADPRPGTATFNPTRGPENDECVRREMSKCEASSYDFTEFNCCKCASNALYTCGLQNAGSWPNYPYDASRPPYQPTSPKKKQ